MNPKQRLKSWQRRGIKIDDYEVYLAMFGVAEGRCQICGKGLSSHNGNSETPTAQLDHDHRTGRPRGILCSTCNRAINEIERFRYSHFEAMGVYLINVCAKEAQVNSKLKANKKEVEK